MCTFDTEVYLYTVVKSTAHCVHAPNSGQLTNCHTGRLRLYRIGTMVSFPPFHICAVPFLRRRAIRLSGYLHIEQMGCCCGWVVPGCLSDRGLYLETESWAASETGNCGLQALRLSSVMSKHTRKNEMCCVACETVCVKKAIVMSWLRLHRDRETEFRTERLDNNFEWASDDTTKESQHQATPLHLWWVWPVRLGLE